MSYLEEWLLELFWKEIIQVEAHDSGDADVHLLPCGITDRDHCRQSKLNSLPHPAVERI